jgi:sugar lactone lactonase YvrE
MRGIAAALIAPALTLALTVSPALAGTVFPGVIQLPTGFQPEGIAGGRGTSFFTGSVAGAGIYRGDLRTGDGAVVIPGDGRAFTGMKVDRFNRLWVAGAFAGTGYVFDAGTGDLLETFTFASDGQPTFINDVVVTQDAAWFTDSFRAVLYRVDLAPNGSVGEIQTVPLNAPFVLVAGFNLNGIDATADGSTLLCVQSATGQIWAIDATTGAVREVVVSDPSGDGLTAGDGILLEGRTLYVVRNAVNKIAVVDLASDLSSGVVVNRLTDTDFSVPTTVARFGSGLYAVNARFGIEDPGTVPYQVVRVEP